MCGVMRMLTRLLVLLGVAAAAFLAVLCFPLAALAAVPPGGDVPVGIDSKADSLLSLDPFVVEVILGLIVPWVVSWVTNANVTPFFKKVLTALMSAVGGMVTAAATTAGDAGDAIISVSALKSAFLVFAYAVLGYAGFVRKSRFEAYLQSTPPALGPKAPLVPASTAGPNP